MTLFPYTTLFRSHVVRCFENKDILHVANSVDPVRDFETINLELMLADMQTLENVLSRIGKRAQNTQDKKLLKEVDAVNKIMAAFKQEKMARDVELDEEELKIIKGYQLLTIKPMIIVANVSSENASKPENDPNFVKIQKVANEKGMKIVPLSVEVETEIS